MSEGLLRAIESLLNSVGLPVGVLALVAIALWKVCRYLGPEVRGAIVDHRALVTAITEQEPKRTECYEKTCEGLESSVRLQQQTHSVLVKMDEKHGRTNNALAHAADALRELAPGEKKERVAIHTVQMKRQAEEGKDG